MVGGSYNSQDRIGCVILGTGAIAKFHAQAIRKLSNATLLAVFGSDQSRVERMAKELDCKPLTDFSDLLALPGFQAAIIANEPHKHGFAIELVKTGRHVLVEKPLALELEVAYTIARECRANEVVGSVVFQRRFGQDTRYIHTLLKNGVIGQVVSVDTSTRFWRDADYYISGNQWRNSPAGGLVMNRLIHNFDLLMYFFGPIVGVFAKLEFRDSDRKIDNQATILLKFSSGLLATVRGASNDPNGTGDAWIIRGNQGIVEMSGDQIQVISAKVQNQDSTGLWSRVKSLFSLGKQLHYSKGCFVDIHSDFIQAIQSKKEPLVPIEAGIATLELVNSIFQSNKLKKWVDIVPIKGVYRIDYDQASG